MYEQMNVTLNGVFPMMLHSSRGIDPTDPINKAKKAISGKMKKTDDDYEALAKLEWESSLYLDDKGRVIIPGENVESMLIEAAKKHKLGPKAKAGILCDGNFPIEYDGPKGVEAMWKDGRFTDTRAVRVQQARLMRTRPIFHKWALPLVVNYRPDQLDKNQVILILETAGSIIGLGDYRPRFGRFEVSV